MPKVLVANRGEIAIRILRSARELGWDTVSIYMEDDASHAGFADEAVKLNSVSDFMNVDTIVNAAIQTQSTHLHPGYGFLSENPSLPIALSLARRGSVRVIFIGPTADTLRIASDKMLSRDFAMSLNINIAPGTRVSSASDVRSFAKAAGVGYPVMIKALDGGGGRGIRVVESEEGVEEAFKRCLGESPSKQVFAEKAFTGPGWKHIEVQVIGDGTGAVNHFWERECSVQRRFQKIVEMAPSGLSRKAVQPLIDASLKLASHLKYKGLGTFEYLVNAVTNSWIFLEINPRVQVEHTITEEVTDVDLVRVQLLLFSSSRFSLASLSLSNPPPPPSSFAVQLRLTAEDPARGFQLAPGTITSSEIVWPQGRGVRIDTWLSQGPGASSGEAKWIVGTDLDSLLAKIIVRGRSFEEMNQKARRALRELRVDSQAVKTNATVLAGVLDHPNWVSGTIDTLWLERNLPSVLELGEQAVGQRTKTKGLDNKQKTISSSAAVGPGTTLLQPGSLFHLSLSGDSRPSTKHTITLSSLATNAFPEKLSGTLQSSFFPGSTTPLSFELTQSTSAAVSSGDFELADPNDKSHVAAPMTGKVVEVHPAILASGHDKEMRLVRKGEPLLILSVMKMENVVAAPSDGYVGRVGRGLRVGVVFGEVPKATIEFPVVHTKVPRPPKQGKESTLMKSSSAGKGNLCIQ
ncbi:hypothetical protein NLJ89_g3111 [Agrocybe chaxingu]|uniref:Pyruvate carboxylase n=1 Tax=Agrocybe chaxingu TaxID=84603 RepID=A0A9W8MYL7_9AGAR|nr:hypothetical protein NLJ89_g3111 [Agrocybe chaxingu]